MLDTKQFEANVRQGLRQARNRGSTLPGTQYASSDEPSDTITSGFLERMFQMPIFFACIQITLSARIVLLRHSARVDLEPWCQRPKFLAELEHGEKCRLAV